MGTGSEIAGEDQISNQVYNHKMFWVDTAAAILAKTNPLDGQSAVPLTTSGSLRAYNHYLWNTALGSWVNQTNPVHDHSDDTQGGAFSTIMMGASRTFWGISETDLTFQTGSGSPTYANTISGTDGYRQITSGSTSGNAGNLVAAGLRYDFAFKLQAQFTAQMSDVTTSYTTRAGFNMEFSHVAGNSQRKAGIEACNTCNGTNIRIVSADGSVRSASNTSDLASDAVTYKIIMDPFIPRLTYTRNGGTAVLKTSNLPITGVPNRSNVFVAGVATATAANRIMKLWGLKAFGTLTSESGAWT